MSQSNSSTEHFGWSVYKGAPDSIREAFLRELNLEKNLPLCTWRGQVGMLDGAPDEIILKYLPLVYWEGQVELFNKHLSVSAMPKAIPLLHDLAKKRLHLITRPAKADVPLLKRWKY